MTEALLFIVLGFLVYGYGLRGTFVLDDIVHIMGVPMIIEGRIRETWKTHLWRKITQASYAVNAYLFGPDPFSFHVTNTCIHILNSLITVWIFSLMGFAEPILGGLLFLVHPLAVPATAYISGRGVLLSSLFAFLALGSVLSGMPLLAFPLMGLSVMSKEDSMAIWPLLAIASGDIRWGTVFLFMPILGFLCKREQFIELTWKGSHQSVASGMMPTIPQPQYSITATSEIVNRLPLWMIGLKLNNKPHIEPITAKRIVSAFGIVGLIVVSLVVGSDLWRLSVFIALISPLLVYCVIPTLDPVMDYRGYFSLLGFIGMILVILSELPSFVAILAIGLFAARAVYRVMDFEDMMTFWTGCLRDGSWGSSFVLAQVGVVVITGGGR